MVFIPPFHDHTREATFDAMVARLQSVVGEDEHRGHVEVHVPAVGGEVLVWSRHERPVALVSLHYDWIRLEFAGGSADVHGLADQPRDEVLGRVAAVVRERLVVAEALGPRAPGDVSGDEPSQRAGYDAAFAGVNPGQWSGELLDRLLADQGFCEGAIDMPVILPAVRAWLGQAAPHTQVTLDEFTVEVYDWPGDDSTACAEPPASLPDDQPWVGVGFCRESKREIDDGLESFNGGVLQLWYPTDDEWRSLFPELELQSSSVASFEAFGRAGSCSPWLLADPLIERILATAATKQAALAYRWTGEDEEEITGR